MIKGIYNSAGGMLPLIRKQEAIANNIANTGTTGFKKDISFNRELNQAEQKLKSSPVDWQQALENKVHVDFVSGAFDKTDNPLNLAIDGDGFFPLQTEDGSTVLTRSGSFIIDSEGFLAFPGGLRLVGTGGTIQVGNGKLVVGGAGNVEVNGLNVATITSQTVDDLSKLNRIGGSFFAVPKGEELIPAISASIRQGYLEASNVDVVQEMVDMIATYRGFEANAKAIQSQDESLSHLFSKVAGGR